MELPFKKIAILGLGLMGGSFCKAILEVYMEEQHRSGALSAAVGSGYGGGAKNSTYIDSGDLSLRVYDPSGHKFKAPFVKVCSTANEAVSGAELVILGCPLGAMENLLVSCSNDFMAGALVMDLGSVKGSVAQWMKACLPDTVNWVGGHPMCGSEKSGVAFAKSDLYQGAQFFLTEGHLRNRRQKQRIEELLKSIGAKPKWCSCQEHDVNVAYTSHLPHLSAAILMNCKEAEAVKNLEPYMAGGFKDSTRIAGANPNLWKDILSHNRDEVIKALDAYEAQLQVVRTLLAESDEAGLEAFLERASTLRRSL